MKIKFIALTVCLSVLSCPVAFAAKKKKAAVAAEATQEVAKEVKADASASAESKTETAAAKVDPAVEEANKKAAETFKKETEDRNKEEARLKALADAEAQQKALQDAKEKASQDELKKSTQPSVAASDDLKSKVWWQRYGKEKRWMGPFNIGPKLNIGVLIPTYGIEARLYNLISVSGELFYLPKITISGIGISALDWSVGMRVHPFVWRGFGAFFIGTNVGQLTLTGSKSQTFEVTSPIALSDTRDISVAAKLTFVTPMFGWRWVRKSGFFGGMELGAQITLVSTITPTIESKAGDTTSIVAGFPTLADAITSATESVQTTLNTIANYPKLYPMPHLMFNIGYLF